MIERYNEAVTYYLKVIKINSTKTESYYNIANSYCKLEQYENALKYYNKTII